jgi:hypothetical protein
MIAFYKNKSFYGFFVDLHIPTTDLTIDMRFSAITYLLGLTLFFLAVFFILVYPLSNRAYFIAGILIFFGVILNLTGYLTKK